MVKNRNIPSLDGLRAISIFIVICAHSAWELPGWIRGSAPFRFAVDSGEPGVAIFFVISGYLITTLLLNEFDKTGNISLKRFYFRRAMRIFPPFYAYLLVIGILWVAGILPQNLPSYIASATYTFAYDPFAKGFTIFHTWSLSIEEQFYLLWPLTLLLAHRRRNAERIALALIVAMPLVRVALYFVAPVLRGHEPYMVQGWIDTMMVGCVLAIIQKNPKWIAWRERNLKGWVAVLLALLFLEGIPALASFLPHRVESVFLMTIGKTAGALCIGGVMIYLISNSQSPAGKFLNNPVVAHIGVVSYSLYLWQQLFVEKNAFVKLDFPLNLLCIFACAEISFFAIERPSARLRDYVLSKRSSFGRRRASLETA